FCKFHGNLCMFFVRLVSEYGGLNLHPYFSIKNICNNIFHLDHFQEVSGPIIYLLKHFTVPWNIKFEYVLKNSFCMQFLKQTLDTMSYVFHLLLKLLLCLLHWLFMCLDLSCDAVKHIYTSFSFTFGL
ncbi:hypothetical protein ACJX0J_024102, partial [Zea mays]